jgi:uncharacterized membrane protein
VRLQLQLRDMWHAKLHGEAIDEALFARRARLWFVLGWPAFLGVVTIFALMVTKPAG